MKTHSFDIKLRAYRGVCGKCGEIYAFKSEKDDLEGLLLSCKKTDCDGKVAVETDAKVHRASSDTHGLSKKTRFN